MIKYTRFFIIFLLAVNAFRANAQTTATTSSPYSRYGLGDYSPSLLPQNDAMGGIGVAINRISGYNNINPLNPASYGTINYTTIDAGIYSSTINLSQTGQTSTSNSNFRLSHLTFAIPVSSRSALSFGLLPYSELGYNYKQTLSKGFGTGSPVDTSAVNYLYNGEGGLSKAYLGYGFRIGKHLLVGANVSYIFGNLVEDSATEIPTLYGFLNSKVEQSNAVRGLNYDYGIQYGFDFSETKHLTLGYSASAGTSISTTNTYLLTQYNYDSAGNQNIAADSLINRTGTKGKIQLPQINHFGISFQNDGKFLVGADYTMGNWSALTIAGTNAGLQNSKTLNVGGQFTPDINALRNVWARTDYRLGFIADDTYLNVNNTNIKSYAVTFGIGLPLAPNNGSFYKINLSAEIGNRGTVTNGLVKENFVNLHLGFTLNDKWFQRFKFQ
jgi:hypothetical protein